MATDPFLGTNPIVTALEQRRGYVEQLRQNTSRLAQSYNSAITYGNGQLLLADVVPFNCTFVEQPAVAYGCVLRSDLVPGDFPQTTGTVYKWDIDARGFYIGAYIYVVVESREDYPEIQHDFIFTGVAMKDLPDYLLDV